MTEQYDSRLSSGRRLAAVLGAAATSLSLASIPAGLEPGTYRLRIDAEILTGDYSGIGTTFTHLRRGLEGTTAATHQAGVLVRHVITGGSLNALRSEISSAVTRAGPDPLLYVKRPSERLFLASNFS